MFVTIDGPNGVGKTTVSRALGARLAERETKVAVLAEPSDLSVGRYVRQREQEIRGMALAVLVVADRLMQVELEIRPALDAGTTVVCDRYVASTLVLQRLDGVEAEFLWQLNGPALVPDLSIVLKASVPVLYKRLAARGRLTRFDQLEGIAEIETEYYEEAIQRIRRGGYHVIAIDTDSQSVPEVTERVLAAMSELDS